MAHFMGELSGSRGTVSRLGTRNSGITANVRGWGFGIVADVVHLAGKDCATVRVTGGSNGNNTVPCSLNIMRNDDGTLTIDVYGDERVRVVRH